MKKIHDDQVEKRMLSLYPHRMSRKGYANLENEWVSDNKTSKFWFHTNFPNMLILLLM